MPLLGSNTTKCFNASATAMRPSPPSGLALLWDAYQGWPSTPSTCANMHGPSASCCRHPFPAMMIILMIQKLSQRLHLSWNGPSESMKQKKIGGSLGSDSNASSPKNDHRCSTWSRPGFATTPSYTHFCGPREGQEIPSSQRSKTDRSLLSVRDMKGSKEPEKARGQH